MQVEHKGKSITYSWTRFLSTYANKWGDAHLDASVPEHLQRIDGWSFGGLLLSGYLLRSWAQRVGTRSACPVASEVPLGCRRAFTGDGGEDAARCAGQHHDRPGRQARAR